MSIVDDMFYELFKITDLYRSGLEEALDQDLARNLVKTLVAMSSLSSAHVELIYCQLQGGFGAGPQKSEKLDPFPGAPSVSYPSVRVSPLDFFAHRTSFPQFLGHVKLQKLQFCKVEELHLVPSVPAQEEVEAALSVFQILCCSALRLAQG